MLPLGLTAAALAAAAAEEEPESLGAATRLRARFGADLAAAAVTQVVLRRRAGSKFGAAAAGMFFTRDGLEQATRPDVSAHRAARMVAAGVGRVVDLGCGIGADALAFAEAGLEVVAVDADPATAEVAAANLARCERARTVVGDAAALAPELLADPATAAFCDPSRRTSRGRTWRLEDFSPAWPFVVGLLDGRHPACVKVGPGLPYAAIPPGVVAEWVSHRGDVVEAALWRLPGERPARAATRLPSGEHLVVPGSAPVPPVSPPGAYLYEPDGAAIRAGAVAGLGAELGLSRLAPEIAYLTGDRLVASPWLTAFSVLEVLPYAEKALRAWVRDHEVGVLEIKQRGLDVDPAQLRRRLKPAGSNAATLVLTPTVAGARTLVVCRSP